MRIVAGNWKMNHTRAEARAWAEAVSREIRPDGSREAILFPPCTLLGELADLLAGSPVRLGAQNLYPAAAGAFTGEISGPQIRDLGGEYVLIGHSERRRLLGETDSFIRQKVEAAAEAGLRVILCVGEDLAERRAGATNRVLTGQIRSALEGLPPLPGLVVAYEPVWAIGTGVPAGPEEAAAGAETLRRAVGELWGEAPPVIYGGSVTGENLEGFLTAGLDGCLAGGSSLTASGYLSLWEAAR